MSPDPLTPRLREAVRERALASDAGVCADWALCSAVAGMLGVSTAQQTSRGRYDWDKFCGRVARALSRLATDGDLVKTGSRRTVRFISPELHRRQQAEAAHAAAEDAAERAMWERIAAELALHGLDSINAPGTAIALPSWEWQRIIRILDRAADPS